MRPVSQLPLVMIDTTLNDEVIEVYPTIERCAEDNRMSIQTIRRALKHDSITKSGYKFKRL